MGWMQAQQIWKEQAPMRRAASPEAIAQAVAMLVASDYLTGEILLSDGDLKSKKQALATAWLHLVRDLAVRRIYAYTSRHATHRQTQQTLR